MSTPDGTHAPDHRLLGDRDVHEAPAPRARVVELLAPAGDPTSFDAALAAGADAIYVGLGSDFNARRSAENFTADSFAAATAKAHLAGARVYVTMNVVIKDDEMASALGQARRAWLLGADALIVQDWGLLAELRQRFPMIECHASTQMALMDARGCAFAATHGVSRVTLARELSLPEIAACAETGVEVEAFGHGALCFCYSGLCLMSSLGGTRSANRGLCAQPCRLPYELVDEAGRRIGAAGRDRPLCPRDLCAVDDLADLVAVGVASVKLEGRMKAPEYVHAVTRAYRDALDEVEPGTDAGGARLGAEARATLLRRSFNRDFTDAYLHGRSGDELMSYERSNNRGELVGRVVGGRELGTTRVRRGGGKGGRERFRVVSHAEVAIALERPIGKGDLLELRPVVDPSRFVTAVARVDAARGQRVTVHAPRAVPEGSLVRVIRSQAALDALRRVDAAHPRPRTVDVSVSAELGRPLKVTLATSDGRASAAAAGPPVEAARTRAVGVEELEAHAARLGGTPFVARTVRAHADPNVGVPFSLVHQVRAEAARHLAARLLQPYEARDDEVPLPPDPSDLMRHREFLQGSRSRGPCATRADAVASVCVLAPHAAVARAAVAAGARRVYASSDAFAEVSSSLAGIEVVPWLDEVCREADHARLDPLVADGGAVAVGNVSELALALERGARAELRPCVPVHNASALLAFERMGVAGIWLSGELTLDEVRLLARVARVPVGLVVFGRARAMTSEHCVLQASGACVGDCNRCHLRRRRHWLVGVRGERHPVTTDAQGRSRVWASRPLDAIDWAAELVSAGVTRLMVDATLLSPRDAADAVRRVVAALGDAAHGARPRRRVPDVTSGHLLSGVD